MPTGLGAIAVLVLALVTPLSDAERTVIATARDDRSHEEEAFAVLLSHAATWTDQLGDEPIRLAPDFAAMTATPERYRGDLCRIEGRLEQRTTLGGAFHGDEWFIRTDRGLPVVVYLPIDDTMKPLRDGERIAINARFYKRMRFPGRDGVERSYAAFVGARPWLVQGEVAGEAGRLWLLGGLVFVLLGAFAVLMIIVKRGGGGRRPMRSRLHHGEHAEADAFDEPADLPSDPAAALSELTRRRSAAP